jgi:hypothetical protein
MSGRAVLAITSHGNAPYLMAARLSFELGGCSLVMPDYYGQRQTDILRLELPECGRFVFLSKELGDLLWPLLLDVKNGSTFTEFCERLSDPASPTGIQSIENRLNRMLRDGFAAVSLDGAQSRRFERDDFTGVLNLAQPLLVDLPHQVFLFTSMMSEVYGTPVGDQADEAEVELAARQNGYASLWKRMEEGSELRFIPRIHACAYRHKMYGGVIHTPPLSVRRNEQHILSGKGVLFSPSGTGTDAEKLENLAAKLPEQYTKCVLAGSQAAGHFPLDIYRLVPADIYGDPNLAAVAARGGWGTIWECLMHAIPLLAVHTTFTEDPEIGHTQRTLAQYGLAQVWDGSTNPELNEETLAGIRANMLAERKKDEVLFGRDCSNGYAFIADELKKLNWIHEPIQMEKS